MHYLKQKEKFKEAGKVSNFNKPKIKSILISLKQTTLL